jgi:UDP-2-acetamido-2,6-beta-L-arabino-hexul-4-ose reductase
MSPRVAVTGANGFVGWHLRCRAHALGLATVSPVDRALMTEDGGLDRAVGKSRVVVHAAGVNRGDDDDVERGNVQLAERLVASLRRTGSRASLVYANSIQADRDTPYGRGKSRAASVLAGWASETGADMTDVRLPNLFGEHGRPDYNSVVATFCRRLADDQEPEVQCDGELSLVHVQQAVDHLLGVATSANPRPPLNPRTMRVHQLLSILREQRTTYRSGDIPLFADEFELDLFNTLRAALFPSSYPFHPAVSTDNRGSLHECVRSHGAGGQTFVSTTLPGQVRGEHFHLRKIERFHVLSGEAEITLRRVLTDETVRFRVSGERPAIIDMPTLWVHTIRNVGAGELVTLFWADQLYDPGDPDTYRETVDTAGAAA